VTSGNRARDRPVLFLFVLREVSVNVFQPPLFTSDWNVRSWCGHHWLTIVWRDHQGNVFAEYLIERIG
jgi:hypothetical protein